MAPRRRPFRALCDEVEWREVPVWRAIATHIADIIATLNDAMDGVRAVPPHADQVGALYSFLAGRKSVEQLSPTAAPRR